MYPTELSPTTSISMYPMITTAVRISDDQLRNRVMLTDFWYGFNGSTWTDPLTQNKPHGDGSSVNLLWTDGHVSAWTLPSGVTPIWGWWDLNYAGSSFDCTDGTKIIPWWWVMADRSRG